MFKEIGRWFYMRSVSKRNDDEIIHGLGITRRDDKHINSYDDLHEVMAYTRLFGKQIDAILKMIDEEIAKSYQFGLKISREHVLKEKVMVLSILDRMGNLDSIPKRLEFAEAVEMFSEAMWGIMKEETAFYFEKLSRERRVRNMYNCHLEAVRNAILFAIYQKNLPYT